MTTAARAGAAQARTAPESEPPRPPVDDTDATAFGDVVRLHAQDGLFLRAEHLAAMQTYAAELARAVGLATGTGVVHGFRPAIVGRTVEVGPGLAVAPGGRVLQATEAKVVLDLGTAEPLANVDGFWVLEIGPTTLTFGTEKVFGNLCDDPCSGSAIRPWVAEGVVARLRPDSLPGFAGVPSTDRRSWLASAYVERERELGGPWLVPDRPAGLVAALAGRDWTEVAVGPTSASVPLGVVWRDGDEWRLDVWTARREIGGRRADDVWRARLAMRPWNAFLAQLLQFQDQLAGLPAGWADTASEAAVDPLAGPLAMFVSAVSETPVKNWKDFKTLLAAYEQTAGFRAVSGTGTPLRRLGFVELPPAGLLPRPAGDDPRGVVRGWFDGIDVRVVRCRADHVPGALERARDLDRIPLTPSGTPPRVDVLVPDLPADLDPLVAAAYGWIAFVRRDGVEDDAAPPEAQTDVVEVHHLVATAVDTAIAACRGGERPGTRVQPDLVYPDGGWEYPGGATAAAVGLVDGDVEAIAVASTPERGPLAALRATLFLASLPQVNPSGGRLVHQVHTVVPDAGGPEAIVVVQAASPIN